MKLFPILFLRECKISYRQRSDYLLSLGFWLLMVCFLPLSSTPSPALLQSFAAGILWIGLLLTQLLNLPKIFREDYEEGMLAELMQSPYDLLNIILCKITSFWIIHFLPIILLAPLLGLMLHLPAHAILIFECTILLASPTLVLLSAFIASISLSIKQNTLLVNALFLPLTIPLLIFATIAINRSLISFSATAPLAWLGSILLMSLLIFPPAIVAALKSYFE